MKVFFDARYIHPEYRGVSRYSSELGKALAQKLDITFIICDEAQLAGLPEHCAYVKIHSPVSIKEVHTALTLNRFKPDVVYSPMQTMGTLGRTFKLILTTHDLLSYTYRTPPDVLH